MASLTYTNVFVKVCRLVKPHSLATELLRRFARDTPASRLAALTVEYWINMTGPVQPSRSSFKELINSLERVYWRRIVAQLTQHTVQGLEAKLIVIMEAKPVGLCRLSTAEGDDLQLHSESMSVLFAS